MSLPIAILESILYRTEYRRVK